jgi:hypothetical protein
MLKIGRDLLRPLFSEKLRKLFHAFGEKADVFFFERLVFPAVARTVVGFHVSWNHFVHKPSPSRWKIQLRRWQFNDAQRAFI